MRKLPREIILDIAHSAKAMRLTLRLTQEGLARRSGVSLGTIKRFENTGQISLESLVKLALVLDAMDQVALLFTKEHSDTPPTIDTLLKEESHFQRGSIT